MYLPSDEACTAQNSQTPLSPAYLAAATALTAAEDASVVDANTNWMAVISRNWQSFADLGPYVALQLQNIAATSGIPSTLAPASNTGGPS